VVRTSASDKQEDVKGDPLKLKRGQAESFSGSKSGFYVVRTADEWKGAFPADGAPTQPTALDNSQMVFFAVAESQRVTHLKVERAVETAEMLYVWVRETSLGKSCVNKSGERAFDAVVAPRTDKPTKFIVEQEQSEGCGEAPEAKVACRLKSQADWGTTVQAQLTDAVECEMTAQTRGTSELIDKVLSIELPPGSTAKMMFPKGPLRGELLTDVYGTYTVVGEAADEMGRRGKSSATIDVKPPKTKDILVQLVWGSIELGDDSAKFPHVNLRVTDEGPKGQRCSADLSVAGLCEGKRNGAYTYMKIPEGHRSLGISVQYVDEHPEKGPAACVHIWYDGARTAEMCDRQHRTPEDIWKVGVLDTSTGKIGPDVPKGTVPMAEADAGAPPPKKPAKKK
jgi:hypothetical protein